MLLGDITSFIKSFQYCGGYSVLLVVFSTVKGFEYSIGILHWRDTIKSLMERDSISALEGYHHVISLMIRDTASTVEDVQFC